MQFSSRRLNLLSSYVAICFSALTSILIMYALNFYSGVAFYGDLMFHLSISTILYTFFSFGTRETVTKVLKKHDTDISVLLSGIILDLFSSFFIITLVSLFGEKIMNIFDRSTVNNSVLNRSLVLYTVLFICQSSFVGFLKYYNKILIVSLASILQSFVGFITVAYFIYNDNVTQSSIIISYVFGLFSAFLLLIYGVLNTLNFRIVKFSSKSFFDSFIDLYKLSRLYFLASTGKVGVKNFENVLLMKFLGSDAVGIYQTLLKILSPINIMIAPIGSNYQKLMIDYYHSNDHFMLYGLILRISKKVLIVSGGYIIFAMLFVELYLDLQSIGQIENAITLIFYLGVLSLFQSSTWWAGNFMICHNPQIPIYTNLFSSILNIVLPFYVLSCYSDMGLLAFIVSIVLAQVPAYLVPFYLFRNYLKSWNSRTD